MRIGGKWRRDHPVLFFLLGMMVALPLLGIGVGLWSTAVGTVPAHTGISLGWAGGVLASSLILLGLVLQP